MKLLRSWKIGLASGLGLLAALAPIAAAHIDVGIDNNGDGDCDDPGEHKGEVPGPIHDDVCATVPDPGPLPLPDLRCTPNVAGRQVCPPHVIDWG